MKSAIHPKYYSDAKVTCACGNEFTTGSTKPEIRVEICAACHPFYTGKKRIVDTAGRLDRFKKRFEKSTQIQAEIEKKEKAKKAPKAVKPAAEKPKKKAKVAKKPVEKK